MSGTYLNRERVSIGNPQTLVNGDELAFGAAPNAHEFEPFKSLVIKIGIDFRSR